MKKILFLFLILIDIAFLAFGYGGKMFIRWRKPMKQYGFTWKAVPAKTQDGYTLMLFHVTGTEEKGNYKAKRTPILLVPGLYDDAAKWLEMQTDDDGPLPMML